jgi:hypothetical protein
MVSKLDFFHPSLSGQATLAALTWGRLVVELGKATAPVPGGPCTGAVM